MIHDRAKDIIKSGGEWISTVELENIALAHPAIRSAAAIAARHPRWDERPVLLCVRAEDGEIEEPELLAGTRHECRNGSFRTGFCSSMRSPSAPPVKS